MPGVGKSDINPPESPGPPRFISPARDRVANIKSKLADLPDFTEVEGDTFVITSGPFDIVKDGEVIGYEVWVKHFDAEGYEIDIDPHRQFIEPPDGSYINESGERTVEVDVETVVRRMISRTVRHTPGRRM